MRKDNARRGPGGGEGQGRSFLETSAVCFALFRRALDAFPDASLVHLHLMNSNSRLRFRVSDASSACPREIL